MVRDKTLHRPVAIAHRPLLVPGFVSTRETTLHTGENPRTCISSAISSANSRHFAQQGSVLRRQIHWLERSEQTIECSIGLQNRASQSWSSIFFLLQLEIMKVFAFLVFGQDFCPCDTADKGFLFTAQLCVCFPL